MIEQIVEAVCLLVGQKVKIKILFEFAYTPFCQIHLEPAFYECMLSDNCQWYKMKDADCLLFKCYTDEDR